MLEGISKAATGEGGVAATASTASKGGGGTGPEGCSAGCGCRPVDHRT